MQGNAEYKERGSRNGNIRADGKKKPTLPDAVATTPAAEATAAPPALANPTIGDAIPTAPLTRAGIYNQVEEGNRVLKRLHDKLGCLNRAEAGRLVVESWSRFRTRFPYAT